MFDGVRRRVSESWLAGLPLSLALHAAIVVTAVTLLRIEQAPDALLLDLSAIIVEHGGGSVTSDAPSRSPAAGAGAEGRPSRAAAAARAEVKPPLPHVTSRRVAPRAASPIPDAASASSPSSERPTTQPPADASPQHPATATGGTTTAVRNPVDSTESDRPLPDARGGVESRRSLPDGRAESARSHGGDGATTGGGATEGSSGIATDGGGGGATSGSGAGAARDRFVALPPGDGSGEGSDYARYLATLRQRIQEVLRYPPVARRRGVTGTVELEIDITPDGAIGSVSVIGSSSHAVLDRAAMEAARSVPRTPFPTDVRPRALKVRLPVVFEMSGDR
jgi:protein TonB